ncbi:MAG: response regulator, partial [Eubacterium sp.]|nr:response regulator [Eubacterium sp.]
MKQILLIEDDYALAMGTTYTLKAEGYEVGHAKNLAEARELLSTNNYSLILLDVMLPDGDGFSYLEELSQKGNATPVIFCTAVGDESNIVRGLDLGADDYVTKPYRVKELLSRIAAVLRRAERVKNNNINNSYNSSTSSNT